MTNRTLKAIRIVVAAVAAVLAVASLLAVCRIQQDKAVVATIIIVWSLGPPIWFAAERIAFNGLPEPKPSKDDLKSGQELAGKFWAAIAASLFAIYKLYNP